MEDLKRWNFQFAEDENREIFEPNIFDIRYKVVLRKMQSDEEIMKEVMDRPSVEQRIEALFDEFPNQDIPSTMIQLVSKGALDWQRALRRIRQRTGKRILSLPSRTAYRYIKD